LNNAIEDINILIIKYIGLLHESKRITGEVWEELIASFDKSYPFDSYL
jgi:nitrogenase molybdenum-iron protein alpha/beta subunit